MGHQHDEIQLQIDLAELVFGWVRQQRYDRELDRAALRKGRVSHYVVGQRTFLLPKDQEQAGDVAVRAEIDGLVIGADLPEVTAAFPIILRRMTRWGFRLDLWFDDERRDYVACFTRAGQSSHGLSAPTLEVAVARAAVAALRR